MKILAINEFGDWGGAEKIFFLTVRTLKNYGKDVAVLLGSKGKLYDEIKSINIEIFLYKRKELIPNSSVIAGSRINFPNRLFKNLRLLENNAKDFYEIINEIKPEIIYLNNLRPLVIYDQMIKMFNKKRGFKAIWHEHGYQRSYWRQIILDRFFLKNLDLVISVSNHVKNKHLRNVRLKKVNVVYNGVDDFFKGYDWDKGEEKVTIVHPAFITFWKGQHNIVKAINILVNKYNIDNFQVLFLGSARTQQDKNYLRKLLKYIKDNKLENYVSFLGYVPNALEYMSNADIIVSGSVEHDPLPTILLEACMLGKPIVTTDAGGSKEIVKDNFNGFVVKRGDSKKFAEKLYYLLIDEQLRRKFSKNSRKIYLEKFSISSFEDRIIKIFNKLE
ncbi:glycosyl transferase family 1 [Thermosipho sp. 1063]|uniref:glycosyltransferase family 4 protein n=1 Tax=Thermosipho sp. 1063 TaxID=1462747 RepID=UPI0009506328|nr:glycosyltransferase family 4 protein [Thermosipho sp. 1063]APT72098.1 glycosyl transferase family 1 [Thermosipho sp. 1063]